MKPHAPLLYVRQDIGIGRPMVLLHGMFADGTQWRVIADLLADKYRVIVVDLLGHGKSPRPKNARYTPGEHSRALRHTLEKLRATSDVTIVGYSMGGTVALQYAADYHDVAQLFMISTPFYLKPEEMVSTGYANSLTYTKISVGLYHIVEKLLRPGNVLYKIVRKDDLMKWLHILIDAYDNDLDPTIMRKNLNRLINNYPFAKNLALVTAPITFYSGKRDVFVVQGQLRALKKIQPLMEIDTLGIIKNDHMLVQYLPQQITNTLSRYSQLELHVATDKGKGDVLVLLHGLESSSAYWANIIPTLSKQYRVVAIDLLGFGQSPKPMNIAYSLDDHVIWLHRTLEAKGITKCIVAGHSLGSRVAFAYGSAYPRQVSALYLLSPVFAPRYKTPDNLLSYFSFTHPINSASFLVATITKTLGPERLNKFIPAIRSMSTALRQQPAVKLSDTARQLKVTVLYGSRDRLINMPLLSTATRRFKRVRTVAVPGGHNFLLENPEPLIAELMPRHKHPRFRKSKLKRGLFITQVLKLAIPILAVKSLFYLAAGILLLSQYKEETLVAAVAILIMAQSLQFIRGSFSLKNEGVAYLGYFGIGIAGIVVGYLFAHRFQFTLHLAVFILCGYLFINGAARLLAGILWTTHKPTRRWQILSGAVLTVFAVAGAFGSLASVMLIVYAIAVYFLCRGLNYAAYGLASTAIAFIRGYA